MTGCAPTPQTLELAGDLKVGVSEKYRNDRVAYTESKTEFLGRYWISQKKLGLDDSLEEVDVHL